MLSIFSVLAKTIYFIFLTLLLTLILVLFCLYFRFIWDLSGVLIGNLHSLLFFLLT